MARFGLWWCLLVLVLSSSPVHAQANGGGPFEAGPEATLLEAGRTQLWQLRLDQAESIFRDLAERPEGRAADYREPPQKPSTAAARATRIDTGESADAPRPFARDGRLRAPCPRGSGMSRGAASGRARNFTAPR